MNNNLMPNKCLGCKEPHRRHDANTNGLYYFDHFENGNDIIINEQVNQHTAMEVLKNNTNSYFSGYFCDLSADLTIADPYHIANCSENTIKECEMRTISYILNNSYPLIHDIRYLREISHIPNLSIGEVIAATQAAVFFVSERPFTLDDITNANVIEYYKFLIDGASCQCDCQEVEQRISLDRSMVRQRIEGSNTIIGPFFLRAHSLIMRQHGYAFTINNHVLVTDSDYNKMLQLSIDEPFYCIVNCCDTVTSLNLHIDDCLTCGVNPLLLVSNTCGAPRLFLEEPINTEVHIHIHYDLFRIMIVNNDGVDNIPIGFTEFGIYNSKNQLVERLQTDTYGVAMSNILIDGVYTVRPLSELPCYIPCDPITIDPPVGQSDFIKKVFVRNYRYNDGSIFIYDSDVTSHDPLRLCVFQLLDECGNILVEKSTNHEGMTVFDHLRPGHYRVRQLVAPQGYIVNNKIYNVTLDNNINIREVRCENRRNSSCCFGRLNIHKYDRCQESIHLQATFGIYKNDQLIRVITTDENGRAHTSLISDKYELRELVAPIGYEYDSRVRKVDLSYYRTVDLDIPNRRSPVE